MQEWQAFRCNAFPVNPRPFAGALSKLLSEGEEITGDKCKAVLFILNAMAYGQLARIDLTEEWARLDAALPAE